jgi:hypothetical protein
MKVLLLGYKFPFAKIAYISLITGKKTGAHEFPKINVISEIQNSKKITLFCT